MPGPPVVAVLPWDLADSLSVSWFHGWLPSRPGQRALVGDSRPVPVRLCLSQVTHASLIPTPRTNLSRAGIPLDLCPSVASELWLVTEKGTDELHTQDAQNHCSRLKHREAT